ncbi:MAG: HlyD family efflux transporter periplasmic adaptor subunit [Rhodothermales bacterium]|nr:HlyD family efflux transporter periplasmic adaptor subunit [Rhodothermales bacterium]
MTSTANQRTCRLRFRPIALAAALVLAGCTGGDELADAYGNFEATEVIVSAGATGRIMRLDVTEGQTVAKGSVVGIIDTVQFALQKAQLKASRRAVRSKLAGVDAQIAVTTEQRRVANRDRDRLTRLLADNAATQKQLDDVDGQISVLDRQIDLARTQLSTIRAEMVAFDAQIARVQDQIENALIINPTSGTVLTTYAEPREITAYGKPLYRVADLAVMELRAYVSGDQLPHIRLGQTVDVRIDETRSENRSMEGEISWISSESEFTPKLIQTKEERVNLVYAFKVRVENQDGSVKIGMPGEVWLPTN